MQSDPLPTNTNGYHGNVHIMVTYSRQNENIVEKKKKTEDDDHRKICVNRSKAY